MHSAAHPKVMEFCQGGELFDRLLEVGNFSENQAGLTTSNFHMLHLIITK